MGIQKSGEIARALDRNMPENCDGLHESYLSIMLRDGLERLAFSLISIK
jgi:hypothetical protein